MTIRPLQSMASAWMALFIATAAGCASVQDQPSVAASQSSCHVVVPRPNREITRQPTAEVKKLFAAAREADEATFSELIATVPNIHEYAVGDQLLLAALLSPSVSFNTDKTRRKVRWDQTAEEQKQLRADHAATLPAKTRMLALALKHGASVNDTTYYSRHPPLHLAMVFGTPEIVRLLLEHGADPNQMDYSDHKTPIEFALDHEYFTRLTYLPELVSPEERTEMLLAVIAAGAQRPYCQLDERADRTKEARPAADYLLWPALAELTRGSEIMRAMAKLGTSPAFDEPGRNLSPLAHASRTGNVGGVTWLKPRLPRTLSDQNRYGLGEKKYDLWLEAAVWAMYPSPDSGVSAKQTDDILTELVTSEMPWSQPVEKSESDRNPGFPPPDRRYPEVGHTFLHHAIFTGHDAWTEKALQMGAQINTVDSKNQSGTPLAEAVRSGRIEMVRQLLALGADPLTAAHPGKSPLYQAIVPTERRDQSENVDQTRARHNILKLLLSSLTPEQRLAAAKSAPSPIDRAFSGYDRADPEIVRILLASLPVIQVNNQTIIKAIRSKDRSLANALLDRGARLQDSAKIGNEPFKTPPLLIALEWDRKDLLLPLLKAGADPNQTDRGKSAVTWAIARGDLPLLDLLVSQGGRIDLQPGMSGKASPTAFDFAVASGHEAMLKRISEMKNGDLSSACLPEPNLLMQVVRDTSDDYWKRLIDQGLGSRPCQGLPSMPERLIAAALDDRSTLYVGWPRQRLSRRLSELWNKAIISGELTALRDKEIGDDVRRAGRSDLAAVLPHIGKREVKKEKLPTVSTDAQPSAKDKALMKKLVGQYYLQGVQELGSELLLKSNGQFEFMMIYGAEDRLAQGEWKVIGQKVIFHTPAAKAVSPWVPFKRLSADASISQSDTNALGVNIVYQGRTVPGFAITAIGCQAPHIAHGETGPSAWVGRMPGKICHVVLYNPRVNKGRAFSYEVGDGDGSDLSRNFVFEVSPPQEQSAEFNTEMTVKNGRLLWELSGQPVLYVREP